MIQRALLIAMFAALPLRAATVYRVDFDPLGERQEVGSARVTIDGDKVRVDYEQQDTPRASAISTDGGATFASLDGQPFTIQPLVLRL
ncbi:MAG: hypothetical protein JOZ54_05515, partial [Acidobacteria bacterium]|nr:hypothetical protein [Acidobacteriota bacterium]